MRGIIHVIVLLAHGHLISPNLTAAPAINPNPAVTPLPPKTPRPPEHDKSKKPPRNEWVRTNKEYLLQWLIDGCWSCPPHQEHLLRDIEYEGYDGFYNNLAHPTLGAIDTPLLRRLPAVYEDSVYKPVVKKNANPLSVSQLLMKDGTGTVSRTGRTAFLVFFGQQVVEEILDAQRPACPPEYFNIKIPKNHPYANETKHTEMPLLRTRYDMRTGFSPNNPRQQLNEITPWLDGGLIYGTTKTWADQLRRFENGTLAPHGKLASSHNGLFPERNTDRLPMANPPPPFYHAQFIKNHETFDVRRFFKLGNPRGNENPFLLTFGILWFRWHNAIAQYLHKKWPDWDDEKLFNEARKWVIATHQHIVVDEWLPIWLGKRLPKYGGYDPSIDPQIDQLFQSAAFRFGHTLVTPGVNLRDYGRNGCNLIKSGGYESVRTCQHYWRPQDSILSKDQSGLFIDIDRLLMGMASQLCEAEDNKIVDDLRGRVFGPLEFSRRDLMAINIQRGRDHGLPDYNTVRKAFNLPPVHDFSSFPTIKDDEEAQRNFLELYTNFDDVDLWVGGLLETENGPGPLFVKIIEDQFQRIRNGDRFWYENLRNKLFAKEEVHRIRELKIYDIIMSVTRMEWNDIQPNPFQAPKIGELHEKCASTFSPVLTNNETVHIPLDDRKVEICKPPETYDYFSSSEISFVFTFMCVALAIIALYSTMLLAVYLKKKRSVTEMQQKPLTIPQASQTMPPHLVYEWIGHKSHMRPSVILLNSSAKQIQICNQMGDILRAMDVTYTNLIHIYIVTDGLHLMIRIKHDYDLVIKFLSEYLRENFLQNLEQFILEVEVARERVNISLKAVLTQAVTREDRQKQLDMFFRVVFSQAFNITHSEEEILKIDSQAAHEVLYTELTIQEFADALSMRADSEFVKKMFALVDKDKNGFVSFREFVDVLIIFAKGSADDKVTLLFDMYDINGTRQLTREDFKCMLKSLMETANADVDPKSLDKVIDLMMMKAGLTEKKTMNLQDFQHLLMDHKDKLGYTQLNFSGVHSKSSPRSSFIENARETIFSIYGDLDDIRQENSQEQEEEMRIDGKSTDVHVQTPKEKAEGKILSFVRTIENYTLQVFWISLYTLILLAIFAERAYYYSVEREHSGLRRIAGYGVSVTRGAASAMMFTYSSLLITMCRSTITVLRDTFLHIYFPFDSMIFIHKYIACWALFFTVIHVIGHGVNLYSISTQTADDLTCLFRNFFHATHEIPKFHYWCWQTITGVTGITLTILTALMYIFALPKARLHLYNIFWLTHNLYPIFYILLFLHGAGRLIQEPYMHYFFLGPCILFAMDRVVTVTNKKIEVPVLRAELLPSDVIFLEIKKPNNFEYKSGQWVRIACPKLNPNEFHPFTLSSAPHEKTLTVHIRAVGPWTSNIRQLYDPNIRNKAIPKIHLEGPYGEGHQDWYRYEVAVLIGGGIGVTPFSSILKDIVFRTNAKPTEVKKVYFLWVTKTQKHFEWLVDIIRDVENIDGKKAVSIHIFITQFYQKFDLRTVLLYICERYFQKVCNRSLLTGLKAITHFGRPDFRQFFKTLQTRNHRVRKIGVFSCGPPLMTRKVDQSILMLNKETENGPIFQHHFKNF